MNDTRAMYGDFVVIIAVPAFMMTNGIFASVSSGAIARAEGVRPPPRISTFSLTRSSCATRLGVRHAGPVASCAPRAG